MLFMVIEHFKGGDLRPIGERFARNGRMLLEGVSYTQAGLIRQGRGASR